MPQIVRSVAFLAGTVFLLTAQTPAPKASLPRGNYDESKVGTYTLPNPLVLENGKPVHDAKTFLQKRRPEIVHLLEDNQYGRSPGPLAGTTFEVFDKGTPAFNGKALRRQIAVRFSPRQDSPKMDIALYLPVAPTEPVPVLLSLNFSANSSVIDDPGLRVGEVWNREHKKVPATQSMPLGHLPVEDILAHGYGVAAIYYGDIEPDFQGGFPYGVRQLFKTNESELAPDDWGGIAAWAWGLSRALDYLETDNKVDGKRVALFGVSRLGKAVLWAGARDRRFAMVIASCSGEGGAALSHRIYGETVKDVNRAFPYWFCANYLKFGDHIDQLPVDSNLVLSLIAPRPVFLQTGSEDLWSDPRGEFLAAVAASPVFRLLGAQGLGTDQMPPVGQPILHTIGYYEHAGGHGTLPPDWIYFLNFMDMHLKANRP
ncbi:MAG: acetylxylan esterase [Acidobacteriota bacterium]|nr:acetylxylan esterase [Acidobacteriota bacterium]